MVSRARAHRGVVAAATLALLVGVVVSVSHGALPTVTAIVLAPAGAVATAFAARRFAGKRFAVGAAFVFALLPLAANRMVLAGYRGTLDAHALPAFVGATYAWLLAIGIGLALALAVLPREVAAGAGILAALAAAVLWAGSIGDLGSPLHESVWSTSFLEWLLVAGVVGAALRAPLAGAALGGWIVAAVLWAAHTGYTEASFWRGLTVAAPAVAIAVSSIALLVPPLPVRLRPPSPTTR